MARDDLVLLTEPLAQAPAAWLEQRVRVRVCGAHEPGFDEMLGSARGLVVRTATVVDAPLLLKAPHLAVVGRAGVGLDNVDTEACRARGVQVVYAPDANTQAVVQFVLAVALDRFRPLNRITNGLDRARWQQMRRDMIGTRQIDEMTVGILGLGRIGRSLARAVAGLGGQVIFHDLVEVPRAERHGAVPVPVRDLFQRSELLSVHVDGRPGNRGFVGGELVRSMRPDVVLVNTSRGSVVEDLGLAEFLRANPAACAILDVHEPEPFDASYPFVSLPNAWLYPHVAGRTRSALERMTWVVRDVVAVLEGRPPSRPAPG